MNKYIILFVTILVSFGNSFSQDFKKPNIKKAIYKNGYNYIPENYLNDSTYGILYTPIPSEIDTNCYIIMWTSGCTDGSYYLTITPEQIYLTTGHDNPNPNLLYWILPIDSNAFKKIRSGFNSTNILSKRKKEIDFFYDMKYWQNEEKMWDREEFVPNCDSLIESQTDKFIQKMNKCIKEKNYKINKSMRIIPKDPPYYNTNEMYMTGKSLRIR